MANRSSRVAALLLVALVVTSSTRAPAQPPSVPGSSPKGSSRAPGSSPEGESHAPAPGGEDIARALDKFEQGSRAFHKKRFKDAVDLFLEADGIAKSPAFAYNAGLAYDGMGDVANALAWLREYLRRAPEAEDRTSVSKLVSRLEKRLQTKGVQQLTVLSKPEGATLLVDGAPVGVTPWTGQLAPGEHELQLQLRTYLDAEEHFTLAADHAAEVSVTLEMAPALRSPALTAPPKPSPQAPKPIAATGPDTGLVATGAVALGIGVGGIAAAVGLELARAGAEREAREAPTQIEAEAFVDRMESLRVGARALAGVGVGLTGLGAVMLSVGFVSSAREPRSALIEVDVFGGSLNLRGRW